LHVHCESWGQIVPPRQKLHSHSHCSAGASPKMESRGWHLNISSIKGPMACHQVWSDKPFWKYAPYDVKGGRVHLDVWWIDEQRLLKFTG
jgi:hypothetical protein